MVYSCIMFPFQEQGAPLDKEDLGQTFEIFQHFEKIIIAVTSNPGDFDHLFPQFISNFRREGNLKCLEMLVTILIGWVCGYTIRIYYIMLTRHR